MRNPCFYIFTQASESIFQKSRLGGNKIVWLQLARGDELGCETLIFRFLPSLLKLFFEIIIKEGTK